MSIDELSRFHNALEEFHRKYPDFDTAQAETLPFQRPFTERILVSLIWGRPESHRKDDAEERKLALAFKSLLGQKSTYSSQSRYRYDRLMDIEQEYHAQRWAVSQGTRKEVDTFEKLAEDFAGRQGFSGQGAVRTGLAATSLVSPPRAGN